MESAIKMSDPERRMNAATIMRRLQVDSRPGGVTEAELSGAIREAAQRSYRRTVVNFSGSLPGGPPAAKLSLSRKILGLAERLFGDK